MRRCFLPLGLKFQPTDEEVSGYLLLKYRGENLPPNPITLSDDVYEKLPSEYCTHSTAFLGHDNIARHYFFTYLKSKKARERVVRTVGSHGYWHEGSKKKIKNNNNEIIGYKKLLKLKSEVEKTEWLMHEFSLCLNEGENNNLVVCVIHKKEKEKGTGNRLVLVLDSDSDSGSGSGPGRLEIARVSCSNEEIAEAERAERGTGGLDHHHADNTVPQFDEEMAEAERGTGELLEEKLAKLSDPRLADDTERAERGTGGLSGEKLANLSDFLLVDDTVLQFDEGTVERSMQELGDLLPTANENLCPAQDEETQQSKKVRYNPLEDELDTTLHPFSLFFTFESHMADLSHSVLL